MRKAGQTEHCRLTSDVDERRFTEAECLPF